MRLKDEWPILATNTDPCGALAAYKQSGSIQTLLAAMKSRGFNFEDTHLTHPKRIEKLIEKLVALISLALVWALLIGEWQASLQELKPKSLFRLGLDFLRQALFFPVSRKYHLLISAFCGVLKSKG